MLEAASKDPDILSVKFDQLNDMRIGQLLFEHCLELEFDFEWWVYMARINVQVDMPAWMQKIEERRPAFQQLIQEVTKRGEGITLRYLN